MKSVFLSAVAALVISASAQAQSTVDSIAAKYKLVPMPEALTIEKTFPVLGSYQLSAPVAGTAMGTGTMGTTGTTASTDASSSTSATSTTGTTNSSTTTGTTGTMGATTDASGMTSMSNVTITLDSTNKGMIWVEGLPQGKFKAYLKQSPATYRVVAQKTETGTNVPEGTLYLDPSTNTLNIALGKAYDDADPMGVFALNTPGAENTAVDNSGAGNTVKVKTKTANSKTKTKITYYTATKIGAANTNTGASTTTGAATDSTQQTQSTSTDSTQQKNQQNQQQ